MRVILFGGSFDPVSHHHLHIAKTAIIAINADIIIFMPSHWGPHQQTHFASAKERLQMCQFAIPKTYHPRYIVSDYEIKKQEEANVYDTLEWLRNTYPNDELYLLMGSNNLMSFPDWYKAAQIKSMATIICYIHPEFKYKNLGFFADHKVIYLEDEEYTRTSEDVRLNPEVNDLLPQVLNYINVNGIYAKHRVKSMIDQKRYEHVLRVADAAIKIAKLVAEQLNYSKEEMTTLIANAYIAGMYHDICKELPTHQLINIARKELKIKWWPDWKILHGPVGAWWVKNKYFLNNQKILRAIAEHTLPLDDAPILSKIIYLADHLEPKRLEYLGEAKYDGFWNLMTKDFNQCYQELYEYNCSQHPKNNLIFTYPTKY